MTRKIDTVLCGIGGYGGYYLGKFLGREDSPISFVGFVDPYPQGSPHLAQIKILGLPVYASLDEFYAGHRAELAILASPIQYHCAQTVCALEHGSHVLCEKPLCASIEDASRMLEAKRRTGLSVAIGYQGSYTDSTKKLKTDILAGEWGKPVELKCVVRWPRGLDYYQRNRWAGRIKDEQGRMILDSPLNNATAHFLHHMLYLLGDSEATSAVPAQLEAQLYRANDIENYDTAFMLAWFTSGARMLFVTTHAVEASHGPEFEFTFEKGSIRCPDGRDVIGTFKDGRQKNYGRINLQDSAKLTDTVAAILEGRESRCGIEAAASQTLCMVAVQESGSPITTFPSEVVRAVEQKGVPVRVVDSLAELAMRAYAECALPGPDWASWVRPGRRVEVKPLRGVER